MTRQITYEYITAPLADGTRGLFVLPAIPEDAPPQVREGIARRRTAMLRGECPCGNSTALTRQQRRHRDRQRAKGQVGTLLIEHEPDCPAGDQILLPLIQTWIDGTDPPAA